MKYLLLLFLFSFSTFVFAQSTIDFETTAQDTGWAVFANGALGANTDFSVVANPSNAGINTSAHVAKYIVRSDADPWSGIYRDGIASFTITAQTSHPTIMVYKSVTSRVDLKLENPSAGFGHDVFDSNTVVNQWQMLTFDYSAYIGQAITRITVMPDFPNTTRTAGSTCYFDNIAFVQVVVPVELTSFVAVASNNNVELRWSTASEINNSGFEIERSYNNINFAKVGFVSGHGTSTLANQYSFIDKNVSDNRYYRLKQINFDGTFKYSKVVETNVTKPVGFSLNQNYPNPFNPTTTISYSIPENSFVTIKIFDVLGNEVASLVKSQMEAGEHSVNFNASGLSSGIYYYQITAGKNISTKKLILMK